MNDPRVRAVEAAIAGRVCDTALRRADVIVRAFDALVAYDAAKRAAPISSLPIKGPAMERPAGVEPAGSGFEPHGPTNVEKSPPPVTRPMTALLTFAEAQA